MVNFTGDLVVVSIWWLCLRVSYGWGLGRLSFGGGVAFTASPKAYFGFELWFWWSMKRFIDTTRECSV